MLQIRSPGLPQAGSRLRPEPDKGRSSRVALLPQGLHPSPEGGQGCASSLSSPPLALGWVVGNHPAVAPSPVGSQGDLSVCPSVAVPRGSPPHEGRHRLLRLLQGHRLLGRLQRRLRAALSAADPPSAPRPLVQHHLHVLRVSPLPRSLFSPSQLNNPVPFPIITNPPAVPPVPSHSRAGCPAERLFVEPACSSHLVCLQKKANRSARSWVNRCTLLISPPGPRWYGSLCDSPPMYPEIVRGVLEGEGGGLAFLKSCFPPPLVTLLK